MPDVVIENPVNSPFEEPRRHFRFTEDGITDEVVDVRRISQYFVPIPRAKKKNSKRISSKTAWSALYSTTSYPLEKPKSGKIAVKVINH